MKVIGYGWKDESGMVAEKTGLLVLEEGLDYGRRHTSMLFVSDGLLRTARHSNIPPSLHRRKTDLPKCTEKEPEKRLSLLKRFLEPS
jgi:hypothetical protein